jgi:UDP:flavonoid glycosyltransferase YjiC (YdhE family)
MIVMPVGSAGDVHPMLGLSLALRRRGHRVTFVTSGYFRRLVETLGLEYVELGTEDDFLRLSGHADLWHPRRSFSYICRHAVAPLLRPQYEMIAERFEPGRTVVVSSCLGFGARMAQEKLGVPLVTVHLQPAVLWSEHASPALPGLATGPATPRWLKRLQFRLGEALVVDPVVREVTTAYRRELGLPPIRRTTQWWHSPQRVLCLFPEWYGPPQPDWPPQVTITQFPLWDEREASPVSAEVEGFLNAGEPPVVFTPGSAMQHGRDFFRAAVEACGRLGCRGILLTRFHEQVPRALPDRVAHFPYLPFSQVLPRSAALVHHGGVGTTAQGLAAGIPQLIMPLAHDQLDNATRVLRFGAGDWLPPARFHGPAVAQRLRHLLSSTEVRRKCKQLALRFPKTSTVAEACRVVEQVVFAPAARDVV